ncbi:hypothetical protein RJ640_024569 [Escallonia rubra]|uniref:Transposase (putative) gypsy type domain-containing protein n=1 Tax=Escallonia rubra TaxID=112253 RepID=A0AA88UN74_9ASTE|nr:hypothetical protein RJ640_024569 [Escallonia rubra]
MFIAAALLLVTWKVLWILGLEAVPGGAPRGVDGAIQQRRCVGRRVREVEQGNEEEGGGDEQEEEETEEISSFHISHSLSLSFLGHELDLKKVDWSCYTQGIFYSAWPSRGALGSRLLGLAEQRLRGSSTRPGRAEVPLEVVYSAWPSRDLDFYSALPSRGALGSRLLGLAEQRLRDSYSAWPSRDAFGSRLVGLAEQRLKDFYSAWSRRGEEHVSEPDTLGFRIEPIFDPLFLEIRVPLVPFQESKGVPAKEVLRENAQSPKPFDAHTLRSKLSSYDLKLLRDRCEIPSIVKLRLSDEDEAANMTTIDEIGIYWDMFINGFRIPLHPFFVKVLNTYGLAPGQLSPHVWRFMSFFIYQCHKLGLNPRVRVFRWFFTICAITKQVGWYFLSRRPKAEANLFPHPPSSNHNWKERFLFVKLPKSQRGEVCNVWLPECETMACNRLKEKDLSETDLEHIAKLKDAEPLESRYPLSNAQLRKCGIILPLEPQDFDEEEEEGENDPENMSSRAQGDPPLFNVQGVLGDIIPDELAAAHGIEEEVQDLDFGALVSGSQPKVAQSKDFVLGLSRVDKSQEGIKKRRISGRGGSRATSSSVRPDTPHRPAWGVSVDESVFKFPHTAWDWYSHAIIPMDRKTLSGYGVNETANGMVQLMSQAMAQVQIGAEKLIAADKVLDEEKKNVMIENNFRREAEKKVEDLGKKME